MTVGVNLHFFAASALAFVRAGGPATDLIEMISPVSETMASTTTFPSTRSITPCVGYPGSTLRIGLPTTTPLVVS